MSDVARRRRGLATDRVVRAQRPPRHGGRRGDPPPGLEAAARLDFRPNRAAQSLRSNRSLHDRRGHQRDRVPTVCRPDRAGHPNTVQRADYVCMVIDTTDDPDQGDSAVANLLAQGVSRDRLRLPGPQTAPSSRRLTGTQHHLRQLLARARRHGETIILATSTAAAGRPRRRCSSAVIATSRSSAARSTSTPVASAAAVSATPHGQPASIRTHCSRSRRLLDRLRIRRSPSESWPSARRLRWSAAMTGWRSAPCSPCTALDWSAPADVSVIGFDDQPDVADQVRPTLTTVDLPHLQMGMTAGTLLIEPPAEPSARIVLPCPLIERESLGPPRSGAGYATRITSRVPKAAAGLSDETTSTPRRQQRSPRNRRKDP